MNPADLQDLLRANIEAWLRLSPTAASAVAAVLSTLLVVAIASLVDRLVRAWIRWIVPKLVAQLGSATPRKWEQAISKQLVANHSAHIIGAAIIYWLIPYTLKDFPNLFRVLQNVVEGYLIVVAVLAVNAVLRATKDVWNTTDLKIGVPVRFATQALQVIVWVLGSILAVSAVFDKSVTVLLSGLAGMTAILALVFRDSILGFVGGIQLSANDMLRNGDWIDVPQYGASGTVEEMGLTTVKVRNFDKTITTVPTYSLFTGSFKNWRGMWENNARRIKRAINLDMNKIRFLDDQALLRLKENSLLESFWSDQCRHVSNGQSPITNLSLFREYLIHYLRQHPDICGDRLMMVRQLQPAAQGLPVEVYCFCSDIEWKHYENVQWEIVDHVLAVMPAFGLKAFQLPTSLQSIPDQEAA